MEACVKLIDKAWVLPQESLQASLDLIETERRLLRSGSGEDDLSNSELLGPYDGKVIAELLWGLFETTVKLEVPKTGKQFTSWPFSWRRV